MHIPASCALFLLLQKTFKEKHFCFPLQLIMFVKISYKQLYTWLQANKVFITFNEVCVRASVCLVHMYVAIHLCGLGYVHVPIHMWRSKDDLLRWSSPPPFFVTASLFSYLISKARWPRSCQEFPVCLRDVRVEVCLLRVTFYMGSGDSNSGSHICLSSKCFLPAKPRL